VSARLLLRHRRRCAEHAPSARASQHDSVAGAVGV